MQKKRIVMVLSLSLLFVASPLFAEWPQTPLPVEITTSKEDTDYLRCIMTDAFRSIYFYRNPTTGLSSDFPEQPHENELIKTEHFFLTFASLAIAGKIGLLSEEQAIRELDKTLTWIEKIPRAQGFFWGWIHPTNATIGPLDSECTTLYGLSDFGWCYCALAMVGEAYPQFKPRTEKLLKAVQWSAIYQRDSGLHGNVEFKSDGTIRSWGTTRDVGADCRVGVFMAIASGQIPPEYWTEVLQRYYLERYQVKYLKPGEAMGYGEQPMALGYFLDQRGSDVGMSDANLGWGQICYAQDMEFPAWGWSSCQDMDGYLGWGNHKTRSWSRINTHAVAAQVIFYPNQVAKNFRAMEKLGLKKSITTPAGRQMDFGFRDSIDVDTSETPDVLIPGLDQNIVFLSLANYLHDGVVWKYFMRNDMVQHGIAMIAEYKNPHKENLATFKQRDRSGPLLKPKKTPRPAELMVDDFHQSSNVLGGARTTYGAVIASDPNSAHLTFNSDDDQLSGLREDLNGVNLFDYNALKLVVRGEKTGQIMVIMRVGGEGGYIPIFIHSPWSTVVIPFRSFLMGKEPIQFGNPNLPMRWTAMWHDRTQGQEICIGPYTLPAVEIKTISFLSLSPPDIHSAALKLREVSATDLGAGGLLDAMDTSNLWTVSSSSSSSWASMSLAQGVDGDCLQATFSIAELKGWINLSRDVRMDLTPESKIHFYFKNNDEPVHLEVKVVDHSGATFLSIFQNINTYSEWKVMEVECSQLNYGWGGVKKPRPGKITKIEFALVAHQLNAGLRTSGQACFDDLKIIH